MSQEFEGRIADGGGMHAIGKPFTIAYQQQWQAPPTQDGVITLGFAPTSDGPWSTCRNEEGGGAVTVTPNPVRWDPRDHGGEITGVKIHVVGRNYIRLEAWESRWDGEPPTEPGWVGDPVWVQGAQADPHPGP